MDYTRAVMYMQSLKRFGIKLGNERFEALLERVGNPHHQLRVIHVAGTNGKGSTSTFIATILQAAGYKVGLYLSPYVFNLRERIQVNGYPIPESDFARLVTWIKPHIEELAQTSLGQVTEFELKTAVGFSCFAEQRVDFAVVEVGLGGRLDATNVVRPLVSVITSIGWDHMDRLGDTLGKIAAEKAGIIKPYAPAVTGVTDPEPLEVIREHAKRAGVPLTEVKPERMVIPPPARTVHWQNEGVARMRQKVSVRTTDRVYRHLSLRLLGRHQCSNAAVAIAAVEALQHAHRVDVPESAIRTGLEHATMPGRMQIVRRSPTLLLDGAHNVDAVRCLAQAIPETLRYRRLILVLGMTRGHDPRGVVDTLAPLASYIIFTQPNDQRRRPAVDLPEASTVPLPSYEIIPSVAEAVEHAMSIAEPDDLVVVTGSFYVVGEVPIEKWQVGRQTIPEEGVIHAGSGENAGNAPD
ncbi:MAG: bifunctional folylpolyglutamate synthase/dihydrofolate synthase [Armatimonadota bacterium]